LGILEANFEFVLNKATNCFFAELCTEDKKMVIQYDPGASQTAISALSLNKEKEAEYSPAYARVIENKLLERASKILGRPITPEEQSNLVKSFKSATGERIYGFLADMGKDGEIYNISSGETKTLREYMEIVRSIVNPEGEIGFGDVEYGPGTVMHLEGNIAKLKKTTGFVPEISFVDGIQRTMNFMLRQNK